MKKTLAWIVAVLTLAVGCGITRESLTPEDQMTWDQLLQAEADAKAEAEALPTPENVAAAEAASKSVADFEVAVLRKRVGPFMATLSMIPGVGGLLAMLGPGVMGLIPLFSPRGRKHYGKAVAQLNPFSKEGAGAAGTVPGTNISPVEAAKSVLRAFGSMHSSEASKAAAETA